MDKKNSILFLGDVVPYKRIKFKNNFKTVFNLECPITTVGSPAVGKINLKVSENHLKSIFNDNILCASISNNHILDYRSEGLDSTLSELKRIEVKSFGLNNGDENLCSPLLINFGDINIAFFAVVCQSTTPVTRLGNKTYLNLLSPDTIIKSITEVRTSVQKIVLYIHWGEEESSYTAKKDVLIARRLIDAGVDIIIGSHAHAPQSIERYKNGIIAYNLGNFIMPKLKKIPSYFDKNGIARSSFSKSLMLWNRVSWGLLIDMETMRYKVKKYILLFNRIIGLPFTPFDKYITMNKYVFDPSFEEVIKKHLKRRSSYRRLLWFISNPHIPQRLKKIYANRSFIKF